MKIKSSHKSGFDSYAFILNSVFMYSILTPDS